MIDLSYGRDILAAGAIAGFLVSFAAAADAGVPYYALPIVSIAVGVASAVAFRSLVTAIGAASIAIAARRRGHDVAICDECANLVHHEVDVCPKCGGETTVTDRMYD